MTRLPAPPEGFHGETRGRATFMVRAAERDALREAGLHTSEGWERRLGHGRAGPGRGGTGTLDLAGGRRVRLKQLRRGGALAPIWRERFAGAERLIDNLRVPLDAARRGVPTPLPVALLVVEGPPGLFRGWLGTVEVEGAADAASRIAAGRPPDADEWRAALHTVRKMHDAGLDHRDLNLGNLLLRAEEGGETAVWICDLDGARLLGAPLGFRSRQRALRRLERSYVKVCAPDAAAEEVRDGFYAWYAAGDEPLASRLARGRAAGRRRILLHRPGWRR